MLYVTKPLMQADGQLVL